MARKQKKTVDIKFHHHYLIPLSLCIFIILIGIYMTITNQAGEFSGNKFKQGIGWQHVTGFITGPGAIGVGVLATVLIGYSYLKYLKEKP